MMLDPEAESLALSGCSAGRGWTILGLEGKSRPWVGSGHGGGWRMGLGRGQVLGTLEGQSPEPRRWATLGSLTCVIRIRRKE